MKKLFKRLLCIVVAVMLCVSSMHIIFTIAADEPQLSSRCETVISVAGKDGNFGSSITALRTSTAVKLSSAIDLSAADAFELDVYVEDIEALKSALTNNQSVEFCFSSNTLTHSANYARANISAQLKNDGWNHVTVNKSVFTETNIKWDKVRHVYIRFSDQSSSAYLPSALKDTEVKIRNICEAIIVPTLTDGDVVIFDDALLNTFGDDENALVGGIGDRFTASFEAVDTSDVDLIKADIRIPDLATFNSFVAEKGTLKISLLSDDGSKYADTVKGLTPLSEAGWYSVQFAVGGMYEDGSFEKEAVTGIKAEFVGAEGEALGAYYSQGFGIANVRGFKYASKETEEYYGNPTEEAVGYDRSFILCGDTFANFASGSSSSYNALKDAENVEFDFYVNNYEAFKNAFLFDAQNNPIDASFNLTLEQDENTLVFKDIQEKVIAQGWNHIILPLADAENNGFDATKSLDSIVFSADSTDIGTKIGYAGEYVIVDKLAATKGVAAKGELKFDKLAEISKGKSGSLNNTFASSAVSEKITPVDMTGVKYIEFDVYVQNFTALKTAMAEKGITDISLRLSSTNGDDYSVDSVTASVLGLIVDNGWNHIAIPYRKFTKGSTTGEFDLSKVSAWSLVYSGTTTEEVGALEGQLLSVNNITAAGIENPKLPEDATVVISEDGKSGVYGDSYSSIADNSLITLDAPVDASVGSKLEFDFYVDDVKEFNKMLEGTTKPLYFALGTSSNKSAGRALYKFTEQVTSDGWNHIELVATSFTTATGDTAPNLKNVYHAFLTFLDETKANAYGEIPFEIKNICIIPALINKIPAAPEEVEVKMLDDSGIIAVNGKFNHLNDRSVRAFDAADISGVDQIEFDIYIENYESYSDKQIRINFASSLNASGVANTSRWNNRAAYNFYGQLIGDGWNHIVITLGNIYNVSGSFNKTSVAWMYITVESTAPVATAQMRIANLCGTFAEHRILPALPDNVIAQLGDVDKDVYTIQNTVGAYFHYTLDRIYAQKFAPVDFSATPIIEFDVYISDYEKFLAAENDPNDTCNSKLAFSVSSTAPELWGQYGKSYVYFSNQINLQKYVTHSGWNHVVVGKPEFETRNHKVDWSALTSFSVYYRNSTNYIPIRNANSDLYIKVANVVNTGTVAIIPADEKAALKPDKDAVYISSIEGAADENGAWNLTGSVYTTDKYKTAGEFSIHNKLTYLSAPNDAIMGYIFDETVDMSDLKTLKLDFFVDLPQFLNRPTNKIEVLIGNNRFAQTDYYYWNIDLTNMKQAWNEVSLDFKDAKAVGNPDLKEAKLVMLRFTEIGLLHEDFEEMVFGIDNLRYISATGNKILRVEGWDDVPETEDTPETDTEIEEDIPVDEGFEIIEDDDVDEVQKIETVVNKTGDVKYNKIVENNVITDWLVAGIILGVEAVVLAAGVIVFILIHRRKKASK